MKRSSFIGLAGLCLSGICVSAAGAQTVKQVPVRVAEIATAQECTMYEGIRASGSSKASARAGGYANAYGAGGYAAVSTSSKFSFETFFVKDCISHFEGVRAAMQSALASSGTLAVAPGGYVLSGRVEDVVPVSSGYVEQAASGQAYGTGSNGLLVTISVKVADKAGRIVFGAPVVAQIDTSSATIVRGTVGASEASGEGLYGLLQRQLALAVARKVAFHFRPMLVVQGGGRKIQLNYGGPLLEAGAMISVTSPDGSSAARYRVTSVGEGTALAQQIDDAASGGIVAGSRATVIEKGDPAANQSLMERAELP